MNENKKYRVTYHFNNKSYYHDLEDKKELENIYEALDKNEPITIVFDDVDKKILVNTRCVEVVEIEGLKSKDFRK